MGHGTVIDTRQLSSSLWDMEQLYISVLSSCLWDSYSYTSVLFSSLWDSYRYTPVLSSSLWDVGQL